MTERSGSPAGPRDEVQRSDREFPAVEVCGLAITDCRIDDVEVILERAITERQPVTLATINLDFLRLAAHSERLTTTLQAIDHRFADGGVAKSNDPANATAIESIDRRGSFAHLDYRANLLARHEQVLLDLAAPEQPGQQSRDA